MDLYDYQVRMCNFITFRAHCEGRSSSCAGSTHRAPRTLFQSARRSQRCAWASGPGSGSRTSTGIGMKGDLFIAQYNYLPSARDMDHKCHCGKAQVSCVDATIHSEKYNDRIKQKILIKAKLPQYYFGITYKILVHMYNVLML